jgi:hypothetical protein
VTKDQIAEDPDNTISYFALEREIYSVVTDSEKLKDMILNQNISLKYPQVFGAGHKIKK